MTTGDLIKWITNKAHKWRKEEGMDGIRSNSHMNGIREDETIDQRHIDAVLVDFINYLAGHQGIDLALYTKDLVEGKRMGDTEPTTDESKA